MSRIEPLNLDLLTPAHRRIVETIAGKRTGGLIGPFSILAFNPLIAAPADILHNVFRVQGQLDRRLFELLVSAVAREYEAPYAWEVHTRLATAASLDPSILADLSAHLEPRSMRDDERLIYDLTIEMLRARTLSEENFVRGRDFLGVESLIEVVAAVGFYSMLCLVLNAFDVNATSGFRFQERSDEPASKEVPEK